MGLFDYVIAPFSCPYCKNEEKEHRWQTKALGCLLKTYRVGEMLKLEDFQSMLTIKEGFFEIHTICKQCEVYVSGLIKIRDSRIVKEIEYRKEKHNYLLH